MRQGKAGTSDDRTGSGDGSFQSKSQGQQVKLAITTIGAAAHIAKTVKFVLTINYYCKNDVPCIGKCR